VIHKGCGPESENYIKVVGKISFSRSRGCKSIYEQATSLNCSLHYCRYTSFGTVQKNSSLLMKCFSFGCVNGPLLFSPVWKNRRLGKRKKIPNYFGLIKNHHEGLQKAFKRLWFTRKVNPAREEPVASMPTPRGCWKSF
jgi:hypothetical protein